MSQPFRTAQGGRVDRDRTLRFTFDGRLYTGLAGDTLASALLANDVHLVGRSFKYHRPRGILSAGSEEPNALVTVDRGAGRVTPNLRATQVALYDDLRAFSQNRFPSLRVDFGAVAGVASPLLHAGFYYKTFIWPRGFWKRIYEPVIRRCAGLGRAPAAPDPDRYLQQYAHCDVLVIGGGPAGLMAALAASGTGVRVILCDEQEAFGGSLLAEPEVTIDGWPAAEWLSEVVTTLGRGVTLLPRTTAFGWYPDNMIGLLERVTDHLPAVPPNAPRERLWLVRAGRVVIATGAIERPLVFPGNDRPGVMLAGAARSYLHRYGVKVGARAVVATADDSAYRAAVDLHQAGVGIAAIVDARPDPHGEAVAQAREAGIPVYPGTTLSGTEGRRRVHSAKLSGGAQVLPCDTVLMCGGWTPSVHLFSQSRGRLRFDAALGAFLPGASAANEVSVGACGGTFDLAACLREGYAAGGGTEQSFAVAGMPRLQPAPLPQPSTPHPRAFVDFQNDVTTADLLVATQEGFRSVEHLKRYTTTGMATDQGKTSNLNALATAAALQGEALPALGLTTFRPPYTPVSFGALAGAARGDLFDPVRRTPLHDWAAERGAVFEDVGTWKRARYFPRAGEGMQTAVARECRSVRQAVGILDGSTLGKIEVAGPDAAAFLDRMYTGSIASLPVGRCRYALLLGEDGYLRDDGIVARLAPDLFHVTTTTGGAASVLHHMEDYAQTEFTDLRAWLTSTTEHWAVIAVQGPRAEAVLRPLVDFDLAAMPPMTVRTCAVCGVPARLFRVSFTGEPGFEVNVPAGLARIVWDSVMAAGEAHGITPYGTEAMHVLRAEMGFIIIGQETDGTATPIDLGLVGMISPRKRDFVGRRSLSRPEMLSPERRQLVGLLTADPGRVLDEGAQVTIEARDSAALGHVTSAYRSETLGRSIALALVTGGRRLIGTRLLAGGVPVTITKPVFLERAAPSQHAARDATGQAQGEVAPVAVRGEPVAQPPPAMAPTVRTATELGRVPQPATASPPRNPGFAPALPSERGQTRSLPLHGGAVPALARTLTAASPACADVSLTALALTLRLSVRASNVAATSIGANIGVLLGSAPCRAVVSRDRAALWLGPDEWLILAPETETDLAEKAIRAAGGAPCSIVDVSHRAASIEIAGPRAAWCLNAFCPLDLDLSAFPIGMCTRTLLGKAEIVLWRMGIETFHLEVARSFAPYVWQCLEEARREFLPDPIVS